MFLIDCICVFVQQKIIDRKPLPFVAVVQIKSAGASNSEGAPESDEEAPKSEAGLPKNEARAPKSEGAPKRASLRVSSTLLHEQRAGI